MLLKSTVDDPSRFAKILNPLPGGPAEPVRPVGPTGPVFPVVPSVPAIPIPLGPIGPCSPRGPVAPTIVALRPAVNVPDVTLMTYRYWMK